MEFFEQLSNNKIFWVAAAGWLLAQLIKTVLHGILAREFRAERLVGSGGMPSSHSATVCALTASVCYEYSAASVEFALSLIIAIIVMYDAMGVRRETGIQAKLLNEIIRVFEDMGRQELSAYDRLKEFVGHTPLQVLIGAILGILVAVCCYTFL